jgi:hypothetical protein
VSKSETNAWIIQGILEFQDGKKIGDLKANEKEVLSKAVRGRK